MFDWQVGVFDPKIAAAFTLVATSEGTETHPLTTNHGYDVIVTGVDGMHVFTDYSEHPFCGVPPRAPVVWKTHPTIERSTASGRYQILAYLWRIYKTRLALPDFSPLSQDKYCLHQFKEVGAVTPIMDGDITAAFPLLAKRWASFPGSDAGQPQHSAEDLLAWYHDILNPPPLLSQS